MEQLKQEKKRTEYTYIGYCSCTRKNKKKKKKKLVVSINKVDRIKTLN